MLKKIFAFAIIAMVGAAFSLNAQQPVAKQYQVKEGEALKVQEVKAQQRLNPVCLTDVRPGKGCDLFQGLNLSDEQKAKIQKLSDKENKERGEKRRKAFEKRDKEMKKILTPAQYEQYKSNLKAKGDGKRFHKEGRKHHGKGDRCFKHNGCDKQRCGKPVCDTPCGNAECTTPRQCAQDNCGTCTKDCKKHDCDKRSKKCDAKASCDKPRGKKK